MTWKEEVFSKSSDYEEHFRVSKGPFSVLCAFRAFRDSDKNRTYADSGASVRIFRIFRNGSFISTQAREYVSLGTINSYSAMGG